MIMCGNFNSRYTRPIDYQTVGSNVHCTYYSPWRRKTRVGPDIRQCRIIRLSGKKPDPTKNWYIARVYYSMLVRVETPEDVWTLLDETVEGVDEEVDFVRKRI